MLIIFAQLEDPGVHSFWLCGYPTGTLLHWSVLISLFQFAHCVRLVIYKGLFLIS